MRSGTVAVVVTGALGLAACSAGSPDNAATTSSGGAHSRSTTSTTSGPATSQPATSQATTTSVLSQTSNVVVTDEVRAELVAAGAALNSLAPSDYTGLVAGETYYAYDATTKTYWGGPVSSPAPLRRKRRCRRRTTGPTSSSNAPRAGRGRPTR